MTSVLIKNATVVNEGTQVIQDVLIKDGRIHKIADNITADGNYREINAEGLHLLPGSKRAWWDWLQRGIGCVNHVPRTEEKSTLV